MAFSLLALKELIRTPSVLLQIFETIKANADLLCKYIKTKVQARYFEQHGLCKNSRPSTSESFSTSYVPVGKPGCDEMLLSCVL